MTKLESEELGSFIAIRRNTEQVWSAFFTFTIVTRSFYHRYQLN